MNFAETYLVLEDNVDRIYVLAPSKEAFDEYIKRNNLEDANVLNVTRASQLEGLAKAVRLIKIKGWEEKHNELVDHVNEYFVNVQEVDI